MGRLAHEQLQRVAAAWSRPSDVADTIQWSLQELDHELRRANASLHAVRTEVQRLADELATRLLVLKGVDGALGAQSMICLETFELAKVWLEAHPHPANGPVLETLEQGVVWTGPGSEQWPSWSYAPLGLELETAYQLLAAPSMDVVRAGLTPRRAPEQPSGPGTDPGSGPRDPG